MPNQAMGPHGTPVEIALAGAARGLLSSKLEFMFTAIVAGIRRRCRRLGLAVRDGRYNIKVRQLFVVGIVTGFWLTQTALGQLSILPLAEVKAGMKGIGKTVFSGSRVEEFPVEILGVMQNVGPRQSIILARLGGAQVERTGVMQGMSGSPVYIQGRLIGAVALAFPFAKEPIAGIRPIEEMLDVSRSAPSERTEIAFGSSSSRLKEIATPLTVGGLTRGAFEKFLPSLRDMGLEPVQGALGGGGVARSTDPFGDRKAIQPGSMISVLLMSGDMTFSADGTVTAIDGDRIYAFGHRFLAGGTSSMPFARAEVLTLLPNVNTSFKITSTHELMGVIGEDRNAAIAGTFGKRAPMVPISIAVRGAGLKNPRTYQMEFIDDRMLAPLLAQMAIYSAIDGSERTLGPGSVRVKGQMEFDGGLAPVKLDNLYSTDSNAPAQAAAYTTIPLSYIAQSGIDGFRARKITLDLEVTEKRVQYQIDQVWPTRREVKPGESIEVNVALISDNGMELIKKVKYPVPVGAPLGTVYVTVSDAMAANMAEFQAAAGVKGRSRGQLVELMNALRPYNHVSVRLSRAEPSYQVQGLEISDPPPSIALLLAKSQPSTLALTSARGAKIAELDLDLGAAVASGTKSTQVEVKE